MIDSPDFAGAIAYARGKVAWILRRYPNEVEDCLQDAAVRAWRGLARFRGDAEFNTWFMTIAVRTALMFLRSKTPQGRYKWREVGEDAAYFVADKAPGPLELARAAEMKRIVREEVAGLRRPSLRAEVEALLREDEDRNTSRRKARRHHLRIALREALAGRGVYVGMGYGG